MTDDLNRFDIEDVEYDKEGLPVIPRITFAVPKQYRAEFLQMMTNEVRSTPGEQLMAVFVKFMRTYRAEMAAAGSRTTSTPVTEPHRVPAYGLKPSTSKADLAAEHNSGT